MSDRWMINGTEFGSCNCDWGCPCQFNSSSTHGHCQFVSGGCIEEGQFNDIPLSGLRWALIGKYPGEIAEGNGSQQVIIDERANTAQREALGKILHGQATAPGANHFNIYNSMCIKVYDPLYLPIEYEIDIEARTARLIVPNLIESIGAPIIDEFSGEPFRVGIERSHGSFEYTYAEIGSATSKVTHEIELEFTGTYGQFNRIHFDQNGIVRT